MCVHFEWRIWILARIVINLLKSNSQDLYELLIELCPMIAIIEIHTTSRGQEITK